MHAVYHEFTQSPAVPQQDLIPPAGRLVYVSPEEAYRQLGQTTAMSWRCLGSMLALFAVAAGACWLAWRVGQALVGQGL